MLDCQRRKNMSDVIQLLPDSVANQIAAGEVIQRPASVIKELVENAVDAGATTIEVRVVDAGRTAIQVIDDGKGMSETDARLAFERHATSKISNADDLFALHTMGFRGEALASIAAVAQVELRTRMESEDVGTHLSIAASHIVGQEPCACPVGSNFLVENLFYNVPARRRFLKSNTTEMNNVITAFERIALVYPQTTFTLYSNDTLIYDLRTGSYRQRVVDVFGKKINQELLDVSVDTTICKVHGFVGKPETAKRRGVNQYFFVNGRFMKHAYFNKAVQNAYDRLLPEGMQVPYFLYLELDPADIDVNIHPTKTEVKFENEQAIWQLLSAAVKETIGRFNNIPTIDFDTEGKPDIPVFMQGGAAPRMPKINYNPHYNPFNSPHASTPDIHASTIDDVPLSDQPENPVLFGDDATSIPVGNAIAEEKSPVHYQYKGMYIMTAVKSGLMIIDQYRAHVRILYERYMAARRQHSVDSQQQLFPEVLDLSTSEKVVMDQLLPQMKEMGFSVEKDSQDRYVVKAIPSGLEGISISSLIEEMILESKDKSDGAIDEILKTMALSLARHAAIPYGQVLSNEEMDSLVNDLFTCENVNYSPDGKPILTIIHQAEIEQRLGK